MLKVIVMACLSVTLLADVFVTIQCQKCMSGSCLVGKGGGLAGEPMPWPIRQQCRSGDNLITMNFTCSQQCDQGCMIISEATDFFPQICTSTSSGKYLVDVLNTLYSFENNDRTGTLTYPWCQCQASEDSGTAWIILILLVLMGGGRLLLPLLEKEEAKINPQK